MMLRYLLVLSGLMALSACSQGGGGASPTSPSSPNDAQGVPNPTDVTEKLPFDVYVAGTTYTAKGYIAGYWKNGEWNQLTPPAGGKGCGAFKILVKENSVLVAGSCQSSHGLSISGYWVNNSFKPQTSIDSKLFSTFTTDMVLDGDDVLIAGVVHRRGYEPGYWRNGIWTDLPSPVSNMFCRTTDIIKNDRTFRIYGRCQRSDQSYAVGYWEDGRWNSLEVIDTTKDSDIYLNGSLFSNGQHFVAGSTTNSSGIKVPGYWIDNVWNPLVSPSKEKDATGFNIRFVSGAILIGGKYSTPSGKINLGYWKDGSWIDLAKEVSPDSAISDIIAIKGYTFITGWVNLKPGYWLNNVWTPIQIPNGSTYQLNTGNIFIQELNK